MNTAAAHLTRKCNVCKHTKPWTHEHFDYKRGWPEYGLCVVCRGCSEKHFRGEPARRKRQRARQAQGQRTTPDRLCYWAQGGIWYPAGDGI